MEIVRRKQKVMTRSLLTLPAFVEVAEQTYQQVGDVASVRQARKALFARQARDQFIREQRAQSVPSYQRLLSEVSDILSEDE